MTTSISRFLLGPSLGSCGVVKVAPRQRPSSAAVPPQGVPGGSGQLGTPRKRPAHWEPSHRLGCSRQPPPTPPIVPPLTLQELLSSQTVCDLVATVTNLDPQKICEKIVEQSTYMWKVRYLVITPRAVHLHVEGALPSYHP